MCEREAVLCTDGWSGRIERPIVVIGETQKRYRIRARGGYVNLPGKRTISGEETALVPKHAVRFAPRHQSNL